MYKQYAPHYEGPPPHTHTTKNQGIFQVTHTAPDWSHSPPFSLVIGPHTNKELPRAPYYHIPPLYVPAPTPPPHWGANQEPIDPPIGQIHVYSKSVYDVWQEITISSYSTNTIFLTVHNILHPTPNPTARPPSHHG